jgi:hypothetical protein
MRRPPHDEEDAELERQESLTPRDLFTNKSTIPLIAYVILVAAVRVSMYSPECEQARALLRGSEVAIMWK